jgi:hypothetical protein
MESKSMNCNQKNIHPRDERCVFEAEEHKYEIDKIHFQSVTTVISRFFPLFNADEAIEKMINGRNWNPSHKYWGMQDYEIKQNWEEKGIKASEQGTFLHEQIENYYLGHEYEQPQEFDLFRQFTSDHDFLTPYRTEWRIFDESIGVAGTIDFIALNGDSFEMYDWKRSLKVINKLNGAPITQNRWGRGFKGLSDIDDTSFNHYTLQLSIYRFLLEKNYQIKLSKMFVVVLHPDYERYYKVEVPYLKEKAEYLLGALQSESKNDQ